MMRVILILVCFFYYSAYATQGSASIGTIAVNPAANAVLVSPVTLSGGQTNGSNWNFNVLVSATSAATVQFQVLNASSVVQQSLYFLIPAGASFTWNPGMSFRLPNGYQVRVINTTAIVLGNVQASIFYASDGDY